MSRKQQLWFGAVALVVIAGATGCTSQVDGVIPSGAPSVSAQPSLKVLDEFSESSGAAANQGLFNAVLSPLWQQDKAPSSEQILQALTNKGFPKHKLVVTPDKTPEGREPDSKEVAIKVGNKCLVGQYVQGYRSLVMKPVYGKCLIGDAAN